MPVTLLLDKDGNIRHAVGGRAVKKEDITKFRQYAAWLQGKRKAKPEVPAEGGGKPDLEFKPEEVRRSQKGPSPDEILRRAAEDRRKTKTEADDPNEDEDEDDDE